MNCASSAYKDIAENEENEGIKIPHGTWIHPTRANINEQKYSGKTALRLVIENGKRDAIPKLLTLGADPLVNDYNSKNALYCAVEEAIKYGDSEIFDVLIAAVKHKKREVTLFLNTSGQGLSNAPLLLQALDHRRINIAQKFLALGADPYIIDNQGRTALHLAAQHGFDNIIEDLARAATIAQINTLDYVNRKSKEHSRYSFRADNADGKTALHYASEKGNRETVKKLLTLGANPFLIDNQGRTPLHLAAQHGFDNIIEDLLGAVGQENIKDYLNTKCETEWTALHFAVARSNRGMIKQLLTLGANPFLIDNQGRTPLHLAAREGFNIIIDDLLETVEPEEIKDYLNIQNTSGKTPLRCAVKRDNRSMVQKLLTLGANPFLIDNQGETPLHLAARLGFNNIVNSLLKAVEPEEMKDFINIKNKIRVNALYYASARGNKNIVDKLIALGAEPSVPVTDNRTLNPADYF